MTKEMQNYIKQKGMNNKYTFIANTDDLYDSFINAHRDLSYPLRKEVKRDRYVLNSQGLKKDIEKVVDESLQKAVQPLIDLISTEIANESYSKIMAIHNSTVPNSYTFNSSSIGAAMGRILGKSIVDGVFSLLDDR